MYSTAPQARNTPQKIVGVPLSYRNIRTFLKINMNIETFLLLFDRVVLVACICSHC